MRHTLAIAVLLAVAGSPALAQREGRPANEPPSITVSGNGQVMAAPDEATVQLGIMATGRSANDAQQQVNAVAQKILDALVRLGIARENVQTQQLQLSPVYANQPSEGRPRITGYQASNTVAVRVSKLDQTGAVIDAGLGAGANLVHGVQFQLRNDLPARERALREAAHEARRKATVLAEALELQIVDVQEVVEGGVTVRPPFFGGIAAMSRAEVATPVSPGEVGVSASVTVRYRVRPK
jgi:uncharacterized protein YggE